MKNRAQTVPAAPKISSSPKKSKRSWRKPRKTHNIILLTLLASVPPSIRNFHPSCLNRRGNLQVVNKSRPTSCSPLARPMRRPSNEQVRTLRIKINSSSSRPLIRLPHIPLSSLAQTACKTRRGAYSLKTLGAKWGCTLNLAITNRMAALTEEQMNKKHLGSLQLKIMRT